MPVHLLLHRGEGLLVEDSLGRHPSAIVNGRWNYGKMDGLDMK